MSAAGAKRDQSESRDTLSFAGLASVMVAAGASLLYATGALLEATRLHGAKVQVVDALPLIPVPNLLAIGIGVTVRAFAFLTGIALVVAMVLSDSVPSAAASQRDLGAYFRGIHRILGLVLLGSFVAFFVAVLLQAPSSATLILVVTGAGGYVAGMLTARGERRQALLAILVAYTLAVGVLLAYEYANPEPLPLATVIEENGATISGQLLVHTDGVWYITRVRNRIVAIQDAHARSVEIRLRPRTKERSVGRIIWDLLT
jgi:hypothetical protein